MWFWITFVWDKGISNVMLGQQQVNQRKLQLLWIITLSQTCRIKWIKDHPQLPSSITSHRHCLSLLRHDPFCFVALTTQLTVTSKPQRQPTCLTTQHSTLLYFCLPVRYSPNQTTTKNQREPTFCLLFSKVDHGLGLVRDCDRGDV